MGATSFAEAFESCPLCVFPSSLHSKGCRKDFPVVIDGVGDPYLSRCNPSGDQRVV
jgi:hypothetical protein